MTARVTLRKTSFGVAIAAMLFGTLSPAAATCLWQTGQLPNDGSSIVPVSIRAFSSSDIWAANDADRALLHWNGVAWSAVAIPVNTPPNTGLFALAVTGTSDSDLWIDATFRSETDQYSKSMHFDGTHWTITRMPSGFPTRNICPGQGEGPFMSSMQSFAVNDVWATGEVCHVVQGKDVFEAISEHWDGSKWNILPMAASLKFSPFSLPADMSGTSDHDIWVVGEQSVVEHFNGRKWSISSPYERFNDLFEAVFAVAPNDVWVVGHAPKTGNPGSQTRTFAAHWDGQLWLQVTTPNEDGQNFERANDLRAVSGSASNDIWAVGETDRPGSPNHNARLEALHWDGMTWSDQSSSQLGPGGFYSVIDLGFRDVWALGGDNPNSGPNNPLASFRCLGS